MRDDAEFTLEGGGIRLDLIDAVGGLPLQTWKFDDRSAIEIGRSECCDVQIANPYVSRKHARILLQDGTWQILSLGRHGVLLDGRRVEAVPLTHHGVLQLGRSGPSLRFSLIDGEAESRATLPEANDSTLSLVIDERRKEREVADIADSDFFQELQRKTRDLRTRRLEGS